MVARLVRDEKVAGSNPVAPTNLIRKDHPKARLVRALSFLGFGYLLWQRLPLFPCTAGPPGARLVPRHSRPGNGYHGGGLSVRRGTTRSPCLVLAGQRQAPTGGPSLSRLQLPPLLAEEQHGAAEARVSGSTMTASALPPQHAGADVSCMEAACFSGAGSPCPSVPRHHAP